MAINIFQGSSAKSSKTVNSAKNSTRAQQAKAALAEPAQVSNSGATAVGSNGTLAKVGKFVGTAANIASKFLPGVGGTIAGAIGNMLNDPEWWQSIPGDAVTLNVSLSLTDQNSVGLEVTAAGTEQSPYMNSLLRPTICEFISGGPRDAATWAPQLHSGLVNIDFVMFPSEAAITQYLLPEIRRVVNAIPLQSAATYRHVLQTNATVYALWQQLKKIKFMLEHGKTYIPNTDNAMFPICQVANSEKLTAFINRLEEYLRSHVRLPHTLCEYLAWRFGRIYRSNQSLKSGLIMYNVLPLNTAIAGFEAAISELLRITSTNAATQQAATDMYNAYYDHDSWVEIREDTQFAYDSKEFALRTNLDIVENVIASFDFTVQGTAISITHNADDEPNPVYIDSALDNPTAFMASTMSTFGKDNSDYVCLFPVYALNSYWHNYTSARSIETIQIPWADGDGDVHIDSMEFISFDDNREWALVKFVPTESESAWKLKKADGTVKSDTTSSFMSRFWAISVDLAICKPMDIYNKNVHLMIESKAGGTLTPVINRLDDLTSLAADMGLVTGQVLSVEHIYAFANMTYAGRKTSMSYGTAEKLVSKDVANFVEHLDVAQSKS